MGCSPFSAPRYYPYPGSRLLSFHFPSLLSKLFLPFFNRVLFSSLFFGTFHSSTLRYFSKSSPFIGHLYQFLIKGLTSIFLRVISMSTWSSCPLMSFSTICPTILYFLVWWCLTPSYRASRIFSLKNIDLQNLKDFG